MNPITLPLIEIYPLVNEPFDQFAALRDNAGMIPHLPPVEIGFEIHDPLSHARRAVNLHNNLLPSLIEQKLNAVPSFSEARAEMPRLQDIPAINKYRNSYPHYDAARVDIEMAKFGRPLHPGQVIFHGGIYPRDSAGKQFAKFTSTAVISTSLCAQVAATHSSYHTPKDVWILRIASGSNTRAIVFGHRGQNLGHEREVLLSKNAQFTLQGIHFDGDYTLYEIEVF
ncbi:hypothetical protein [Janthinobacterium sp. UMAB-56]|uniref:hypothetical protein n=1 Tax=Janthinobacterium sp. UMAB-56 TaxID=1365361 RepID=UPI001C56EF2D|nr:hypothetical protein [Janthinobacterium sp. UMAB-56]